jgi:hypothetical protein
LTNGIKKGSVHQRLIPWRTGTVNAAQIAIIRLASGMTTPMASHALVPIERKITIQAPTKGMNASPGYETPRLIATMNAGTGKMTNRNTR